MNHSAHNTDSLIRDHWSQDSRLGLGTGDAGKAVLRIVGEVGVAELEQFVQGAEARSLEAGDGVVTRKRLLNVLVEALENLRVHTSPELARTVFAELTATDEAYTLTTGNAMPSAEAAIVSQRIDVLNDMSEADLRQHFLLLLGNSGRTERGGAGLGLITIARKVTRPLRVLTHPRDETTRYLIMQASVSRHA
ncbi:MAG TPA: DUF6272 family protein [Flavobacteriales bacterium]|nr:DUF6272 family protein [Flavobacteriales bacterium]